MLFRWSAQGSFIVLISKSGIISLYIIFLGPILTLCFGARFMIKYSGVRQEVFEPKLAIRNPTVKLTVSLPADNHMVHLNINSFSKCCQIIYITLR